MAKKFLKVLDPKNLTGYANVFKNIRGYGVVLGNGVVWVAAITKTSKTLQRFKDIGAARREFGDTLETDKDKSTPGTVGKMIFTNCAEECASLFGDYPHEWTEIATVFDIKPPRSSGGVNNSFTGTVSPGSKVWQVGSVEGGIHQGKRDKK